MVIVLGISSWEVAGVVIIRISVGFCVARSTVMGNAKASNRGTSDRYRFPRFFFICVHENCFNRSVSGICGRNVSYHEEWNDNGLCVALCRLFSDELWQ